MDFLQTLIKVPFNYFLEFIAKLIEVIIVIMAFAFGCYLVYLCFALHPVIGIFALIVFIGGYFD